jgi:adenine C2-methylase RlmN of 23S rRNA A2503 and tRNA A37
MKLKVQKQVVDPISGKKLSPGSLAYMDKYTEQLGKKGFDYAIALATEAEVQNGSACGQLAMIIEEEFEK